MSTWQQQDAQEYFSKLLDDVDQEIAKAVKKLDQAPSFDNDGPADETASSQHSDDSGYQSLPVAVKTSTDVKAIRNPLEGLIAQRVGCTRCSHCDGLSMIPFNCLTLNLDVDKSEYDLYERLDAYAKLEEIEGVECGKCTLLKMKRLLQTLIKRSRDAGLPEANLRDANARLDAVEDALENEEFDDKTITQKCKISPQNKVNSVKTKQAVIARPPQSLAIHINRSVFDETTGRMFKNSADVRFPQLLDLGPWCLGSNRQSRKLDQTDKPEHYKADGHLFSEDEERWILNPTVPMNAGSVRDSRIAGPIYELRAIVTHVGRHENGHYICYRNIAKSTTGKQAPESAQSADLDELDGVESDGESTLVGDTTRDRESDYEDVEEPQTEWWRLSDETVYRVAEENVLGQSGVFMLFYDCVDPIQLAVPSGVANTAVESVTEKKQRTDQSLPAPEVDNKVTSVAEDLVSAETDTQSTKSANQRTAIKPAEDKDTRMGREAGASGYSTKYTETETTPTPSSQSEAEDSSSSTVGPSQATSISSPTSSAGHADVPASPIEKQHLEKPKLATGNTPTVVPITNSYGSLEHAANIPLPDLEDELELTE